MKTEKPILFSTPMVQAILDGRKTQTRRICKPIPIYDRDSGYVFISNVMFDIHDGWDIPMYLKDNAKWEAGDILWVRETWRVRQFPNQAKEYFYKASIEERELFKWKPSIFMPKEACRIKLLVKNIRVERLCDISEEDAMAEGINLPNYAEQAVKDVYHPAPSDIYAELWDEINGTGSWIKNPWVWVIEFERIK
jgi:hypothetical protein